MRAVTVLIGVFLATVALSTVAEAQLRTPGEPAFGFAEIVAQSAFGNVTSQSFGGEVGVGVTPTIQVFVDVGRVRDTSPSSLGTNAQLIASFLSSSHTGVGYQVRQPITFGLAGVRYTFQTSSRIEPYVLGGVGIAKTKKDVTFSINGSNITDTLNQFEVQLGSDLSGSSTDAMVGLGVGAVWPAWRQMIVDVQYKWGRVFADEAVNVNRAGIGIGVRF
jgi:opacity protein-like surface antigen